MSTKTPGQAAYEAWQAARWPDAAPVPWIHSAIARKSWDAAANAVAAPLREQLSEAHQVIEEILSNPDFNESDASQWRARAGIETAK